MHLILFEETNYIVLLNSIFSHNYFKKDAQNNLSALTLLKPHGFTGVGCTHFLISLHILFSEKMGGFATHQHTLKLLKFRESMQICDHE